MKLLDKIFYYLLSVLNIFISKDGKAIVIYGRNRLNDNSEAILDFLVENGFYEKYRLYLIINRSVEHPFNKGVRVITNPVWSIFYTLRAKFVFHAQGMSICKHYPGKQIIFNLWHGSPLKSIGYMANQGGPGKGNSYFLCASPFYADINKKCFRLQDQQIFIGSNPRNDYLFRKIDIRKIWNWEHFKKIIMFMPTFHNSKELGLENEGGKDFPILDKDNIYQFNDILAQMDCLLVIKPHPYQDNIDFLKGKHSNIVVLYNPDIQRKGIKLYEFLGGTDALLTDFSSVFFDYLLINKPIGFVTAELEEYSKGRGFVVDNPKTLLPGEMIKSLRDLEHFIYNVNNGVDNYQEERDHVNEIVNSYKTPDASKRILDFVGIRK